MSKLSHPSPIDYKHLAARIASSKTNKSKYQKIVNLPFDEPVEMALMFLGIIVLLMVDDKKQAINRVALSNTQHAEYAKYVSVKKFEDIIIPLDYDKNLIAKAIKTGKPQSTDDWEQLFTPELSREEALLNQASSGIAYSAVYPLKGRRTKGALIFSYYQYPEKIGAKQLEFMSAYSEIVAKNIG